MTYGQIATTDVLAYAARKNAIIVDLRSDTISQPSPSMRRAMFEAEVGDDVYGEDPTVKKLEDRAAKMLGKEAALFVSSGTMGNLIAIMIHCDERGSELYCGEDSHIVHCEQGGPAQIACVTVCPITSYPDGTFDLSKLEIRFRKDRLHEPISKLVTVENTIGGKVVPQEWINKVADLAKKYGLKLHMDGARLFNASVASGLPADKIVEKFDSVTFCLSKGLGAPVGSILCGSNAFIQKAKRVRKVLGGGVRQSGFLAAAGLVALDEVVPVLKYDHQRALRLAQAIEELKSSVFSVDLKTTKTNMVQVKINSSSITATDFISRLQTVEDNVVEDKILVRAFAIAKDTARFVLYYNITDDQINSAIAKIKHIIRKFDKENDEKYIINNINQKINQIL